jgi:hypothetical protein
MNNNMLMVIALFVLLYLFVRYNPNKITENMDTNICNITECSNKGPAFSCVDNEFNIMSSSGSGSCVEFTCNPRTCKDTGANYNCYDQNGILKDNGTGSCMVPNCNPLNCSTQSSILQGYTYGCSNVIGGNNSSCNCSSLLNTCPK